MMYKIVKEKFMFAKLMAIILTSFLLLAFGKYSATGALQGLYMCGQVLIPSLFPFMVLANFTVKSGISEYMGKYLSGVTKTIFGVSGQCGTTILLSFIGGFPVGARGIASLYESGKISEKESEKLAYSLVCAGPGFLIVFIGTTLLNSIEIGICILVSLIISVIILGFVNKLIFIKENSFSSDKEIKQNHLPFSDALIISVRDCTYAMIEMCGIVVIFSALISISEYLFSNLPHLYTYIATLLEVTTASKILSGSGNILLLAFAVGFGGLSVHFQIFQALKNIPLNKGLFTIFRLLQGIITAVFSFLFMKIFNISVPVYSSVSNADFTLSTSVAGSILLLLTGMCFLYTFKSYKN